MVVWLQRKYAKRTLEAPFVHHIFAVSCTGYDDGEDGWAGMLMAMSGTGAGLMGSGTSSTNSTSSGSSGGGSSGGGGEFGSCCELLYVSLCCNL